MSVKEVKVPDIGDFSDVPVIAILVSEGDTVAEEDGLLELESDKATMEVPSPMAGKIVEILVSEGDEVSEGSLIMKIEAESADGGDDGDSGDDGAEQSGGGKDSGKSGGGKSSGDDTGKQNDGEADKAASGGKSNGAGGNGSSGNGKAPKAPEHGDEHGELVVLGSGPGGYSAAFRAADLGLKVILIERYSTIGGVCLNVGCIPSKALLHAAKVITESEEMAEHGLDFGKPDINLDELKGWKDGVVKQLTGGLSGLAKQRKVTIVEGKARFENEHMLVVETDDGEKRVSFDQCIIAAGSEPVKLPFVPHDDPRVIDSTGALELEDFPERMLVLGGGIIGLEMGCVYDALGAKITVVELMDQLIPECDKDIVKPLHKRIEKRYENILLKTKVTAVEAGDDGLTVTFEDDKGDESTDTFDKVLVSVGRKPNGKAIDADKAGVNVDDKGFIAADNQMRTNKSHIFAIGDVVGQPMLAHKAVHEGKVAAEVAAGHKRAFDARLIPSVAYTDPEVAWVGVTENEAKANGQKVGKGVFPWAASGRSLSIGRNEGVTKLIFDPDNDQVLGAGIVGPNAGDLIAEVALAIEMGCDATDIGHTIHPHPTLSETVNFAAEMFEGTITDLMPPKKR